MLQNFLPSKQLLILVIACIIISVVKPSNSSTENHSGKVNASTDGETRELVGKLFRPRPVKISENFNPTSSYVVMSSNGSLTYVFSENTKNSTKTKRNAGSENLYPSDSINAKIHENDKYGKLFGSDNISGEDDKLRNRFDEMNQRYFCESDIKLVYPKYGVTEKNTTVVIINTEEFKQGVRVETCRNVGNSCNIKYHTRTKCVQSYYYRTLLAYNVDTNEIFKEAILLPSGCKCAELMM